MAKKKHIGPYLILWRVQASHKPVDNDWTIFDSFLSLAQRNSVFEKIKSQPCQIIEFKRETDHKSPIINPYPQNDQANITNRP